MRITAKQFALSLDESVEGPLRRSEGEARKSAAEVKVVIKNFVALLAKNNKIAWAEKIIKEFTKIWNNKHGVVEAEVISAGDLSRETVKLLKSYIAKFSGAKEVKLEEKVDKNILGGVIMRYGDKVLDGSLKTQLADLKNRMIK